jgi:hypothetical protein
MMPGCSWGSVPLGAVLLAAPDRNQEEDDGAHRYLQASSQRLTLPSS